MSFTLILNFSWATLVWVLVALILALLALLAGLGDSFGGALFAFARMPSEKSSTPIVFLWLSGFALLAALYTVFA
jgi:hypothetical protein